jgi:DNA-directed RNA polymerase subunit M/transcription elongation factor TFIIS
VWSGKKIFVSKTPNSNNMLYPAEDRENKKLIYVCRRCEVTRENNPPNLINKTVLQKTEE